MKELQEFVGIVTFYHRFVPAAARFMQPLFRVLANKPIESLLENETTTAFDNATEALAKATMLAHPTVNAETVLTVNKSDTAVGRVF